MIGLTGAHRVGKTTLAKGVASQCDLPFYETTVAKTCNHVGLDPSKPMRIRERFELQWMILEDLEANILARRDYSVADRTPLDCLAYLLAYMPSVLSSAREIEIQRYATACFEITNANFDLIALVPPVIEIVDDPAKSTGVASRAHQFRLHAMLLGLIKDERCRVHKAGPSGNF